MKKCLFLVFVFVQICFTSISNAQIVNIPDANFKAALLAHSPIINTNGDGEIQLSEAQAFTGGFNGLSVSNKNISDLTGIEAFTSITKLVCSVNQLTSINVSSNTALTTLKCGFNNLTSLNLTANVALTTLDCKNNLLTSLDLTNNIALTTLDCGVNQLTSLLIMSPVLTSLVCDNNDYLPSLDLTACIALTTLECHNNILTSLLITSPALTTLECSNNQLVSLDLTACTSLYSLNCYNNQLTSLLTASPVLHTVKCYDNQLTSLDLSVSIMLYRLECYNNQLSSLDLTANTALFDLKCSNNQLSSLIVVSPVLVSLSCVTNLLTSLDLSACTALITLSCQSNKLTSLDLRANTALTSIGCGGNTDLTYLDIRNGNNTAIFNGSLMVQFNSNLTCISVDDPVWSAANWTYFIEPHMGFSANCNCGVFSINIDSMNHVSCTDSGYVSAFVSGGNGPFQYEWFNAPLSVDSILIADTADIYTLKITDVNLCESFRSIVVEGPNITNGFDLNTNLQAGVFQPGRITSVNLSALNDGCVIQNAQLQLVYNGPLSFESSTVPPTSQRGDTLLWDLGNMEYSLSDFFTNLSFRTDTLAQAGDLNCFEISLTPFVGDADTSNNTKLYCFQVVNSYDPNDLQVYPQGVCAENYTLKDETLTYTVRFQNTGNAPAIDVTLKDSLSPYLNINTLRVISHSHESLITEVVGNRTLKFNFYNINLADSLSNEEASKGYVTFQIDPYPGLNENTVIENTVGIYFDFNPPVITNTTLNTLVSILPTGDITVVYDTLNRNYTFERHRYTKAGTYHRYFTNQSACDSMVVLKLSKPLPSLGIDMQSACASYTWIDGNTYTSSTTNPSFTFEDAAYNTGDSIVSLHLTIYSSTSSSVSETVCETYTAPDNQVYTSSGTYTAVIPNYHGCDSTITINLTVNSVDNSIIDHGSSLEATVSGASYQWLNCGNNFEALNGEVGQTFIPVVNGMYAVEITQNGCSDTSQCMLIENVGLSLIQKGELSIFPNPAKGNFILDFGKEMTNVSLQITDVLGREIYHEEDVNGSKHQIILKEAAGIYQLVARVSDNEMYILKLMIE